MRLIALSLLVVSCRASSTTRSETPSREVAAESTALAERSLHVEHPAGLVGVLADLLGGSDWSVESFVFPADGDATSSQDALDFDMIPLHGVFLTRGLAGYQGSVVAAVIPTESRSAVQSATRASITLVRDGDWERKEFWSANFAGNWRLTRLEIPGT